VCSSDLLGMLYLDGTKLRQAVYNLLSNSAKFTQNGEIILNASRYQMEGADRISISVTDTGVGISKDAQSSLFTNFTQANASITAKFGGTGLGLSLSQNLCRLMGGDITVESDEGKGACFTIDLPASLVEIGEIDEIALPPLATDGATDDGLLNEAINDLKDMKSAFAGVSSGDDRRPIRGKILVIDDDRSFLELTERLLTKEGYSAICTDNPESVLQIARTVKPAAIFVDVLMPKFDGWDVINTLKADPATKNIPVFMLSILEERRKAEDHLAADFITKPLDSAKLRKALSSIENSHGRQDKIQAAS